jgi:acetoin utilization deacetylase AcuC-like enzyme
MKKPVFIYSQEFEKYSYPPGCKFVTQRAVKTREILRSLNLLGGEREKAKESFI